MRESETRRGSDRVRRGDGKGDGDIDKDREGDTVRERVIERDTDRARAAYIEKE